MTKKLTTTKEAVNRTAQFLAHETAQSSGDNVKINLEEMTKTSGTSLVYSLWSVPGYFEIGKIPISVKKKMRKDPQIRLALSVIKAPIQGLPLQVMSKDKDVAGFIQEALNPVWRSVLRSSLNAVDFGNAPHEKLFEIKNIVVTADNGQEKAYPNSIVYHKLKDLDPESITAYLSDVDGNFSGFLWENEVTIPAEKSFVMVNEKEFGNPYGQSRLDCVYDAWYWCNIIFMFTNRYYERKADPSLKGRAPVGIDENTKKAKQMLLSEALANLKSSSAIVLPNTRDDKGNPEWDCEYMLDDKRGEMFQSYIDMLQALKLRGLLVPERVLTQDTKLGSLAMVETMTDTFLKMEQQLIADIFEHINKYLINPLVEFNFGKEAQKAYAVPGSITKENTDLIKEIIFKVIDAETALGSNKPYDTAGIINTAKMLEGLNVPIEIPKEKPQRPVASIRLSSHTLDAPISIDDIDKFAKTSMAEFDKSMTTERARIENPIRNHNKEIVRVILKNLKNAKYNGNRLAQFGNQGMLINIRKEIDKLHEKILNKFDPEETNKINNYLKESGKLAQQHYQTFADIINSEKQLAKRQRTGVKFLPGKGFYGMDKIIEDNAFGIQQNIQNITLREDRKLLELVKNALDNERIMMEISFSELATAPQKILIGIEETLKKLDDMEFAIDKTSGFLAEIKNLRFNESYTNSTVEAHYRAVYRRAIIELAQTDGIDTFKAYRESGGTDMSQCAKYDGQVGTLNWWDVQAERLGAGGGIRQFGLHFGCTTMFYPMPTEILAKEGIKVETLQDV